MMSSRRHAETSFVGAVTGPANLMASVLCSGIDHLYEYVTTTLGAMPAIAAVDTSPAFERVKQSRSVMRGPYLAPPYS